MENTLDSICPSETPQEEMSYLFGRDPSILAYGQRPLPSKDTKKNLLSLYETKESNSFNENISEQSESLQTVKVYLRLKPFPKKLKLTEEQQEAYKIIDSTTLVTKLPMLDNNISTIKQSKYNEIISRSFTFSRTFGPETTQLELFEQTVQQQMIDFLAGHNCTIMTYGTTSSGKSYTLQGTSTSPGLIPRALEFVFSNITTRPNPSYKPLHYCDIISLNALERAQELEGKTKLLTFSSVDKHQYINAYKQMQKLLQEESVRPSQCHDAHYSIWVSFVEIYNEIIYDLLSTECRKKRIPLKLGTDSNGRAFIKGLKTIYVNSAAEAYQVLMAGQYNLKIAATALNAKSSRSHCIFTITLLKYYKENSPDTVEVSIFSFCDLAGSERLKKTLNIGDRLKEAQNINTSLLVLGRCLKSIHEGQLTRAKADTIGPFRESKLTRLFQRALSGKEHLALIVNVNPLPNLYVETQSVLNFAAIAKRIVIKEKKQVQKKFKSKFSQIVTQSIETVTDWSTTDLESIDWQCTNIIEKNSEYVTLEEYMNLVNENENLKKEIAALKNSALTRDLQSRQEMAEKYIAMINDLEIDWKQRINDAEIQYEDTLEWTVKQIEEFYEGKLSKLHRKKRRRTDCDDDSDEDNDCRDVTLKELSKENARLKAENKDLKKTISELKIMNKTLTVEKNKTSFELGLSKKDLKVARNLLEAAQKDICFNQDGKAYAQEMTSQLFVKDEQIKKLEEILNEAKEEYITTTSDLKKKELHCDKQAKIIIENEEKIEDLKSHLEQVNICLAEKSSLVEYLEEKLEHQSEKLLDNENKILQLQTEINALKHEKLTLLKCYEKPTVKSDTRDSQQKIVTTNVFMLSQTSIQNECQEIIKKELIIDDVAEDFNITQRIIKDTIGENIEVRKFTQAEVPINEIAIKTDTYNLNSVKTPSKKNSESPQNIQAIVAHNNVCECMRVSMEVGCQIDIKNDKSFYNIKNNPAKSSYCVSTQTTATIVMTEDNQTNCNEISTLKEEAVQTSEIIGDKLQSEELIMRYNNIKTQYEQECLKVKQSTEELCEIKKTVQLLQKENDSNRAIIEEYKLSAETFKKKLSFAVEEKQKVEKALLNSNLASEKKIAGYEHEINQSEKNLLAAKDNARQYLEKLETTQKELDNYISRYKEDKEINVYKLNNLVMIEKGNSINDINVGQDEDIEKMETNLETIAKLKDEIIGLNKNLKACQIEKNCVQNAFDENNKKLLELENRLEQITFKEQEKDIEIATLQKELKCMIQGNENTKKTDDLMEAKLKNTVNELTQTKEILSQKEQYIKELKIHLENFERNAKIFNLLEDNVKERQAENERLRNINDELKTNLAHKECEMDAFMKNRDETVMRYEALVKNQQEELDRQKREVMRYQELFHRQAAPINKDKDYKKLQNHIQDLQDRLNKYEPNTKAKDDCDTSEDEVLSQRQPKRRGKKTVLSTKQEDIPVIELSGSESKRNTRRMALSTTVESPAETKRTTRRKKLYVANDSFADIEPSENIMPATAIPTRNLRNRKK